MWLFMPTSEIVLNPHFSCLHTNAFLVFLSSCVIMCRWLLNCSYTQKVYTSRVVSHYESYGCATMNLGPMPIGHGRARAGLEKLNGHKWSAHFAGCINWAGMGSSSRHGMGFGRPTWLSPLRVTRCHCVLSLTHPLRQ